MKGNVIVDTEINDMEAYAEYVEKIPAVVAAHGGRFLVRTSDIDAVEGGWAPKRLVIMEFDSLEAARGFVGSAEYVALSEVRRRASASKSRIVVVEGHDSGG